jgi:DNA polymerase III epsilon subunit-like protein
MGESKMKATSDDTIPVINARASLSKFFQGTVNREVIIIKLSTNGLIHRNSPLPSVLGVAAAKFVLRPGRRMEFVDHYERFYFPREGERYDPKAVILNGLDEQTMASKRQGCKYSEGFDEDEESLREYCQDTHLFVGHNIDGFEAKYLLWLHDPENRTFDLMKENVDILRLEQESGCYSGEWKWPKLQELSEYYGISFPDQWAISEMQYVQLTSAIFQQMLSRSALRRIVISS